MATRDHTVDGAEITPRARTLTCVALAKAHPHPELPDKTIWEVFQAERQSLVPYVGPFDGFPDEPLLGGRQSRRAAGRE